MVVDATGGGREMVMVAVRDGFRPRNPKSFCPVRSMAERFRWPGMRSTQC
jgi:hypothetical protein